MRVLLVDGNWLLKRSFFALKVEDAFKNRCGGSYGFLIALQYIIKKHLPDRVYIMWDGFQSGRYRYDIYKPYKSNRKNKWIKERDILSMKIRSQEDQDELDMFSQKMIVKNLMEEFFIRQIEVDYIEADDLIAGYILESDKENRDEDIYIYSRDKDYRMLVSKKVSLIHPDFETPITINNFKQRCGYIIENELLFKCFEGDSADKIEGVKGIRIDGKNNTLEKYIPDIREKKYSYKEIVDLCLILKEQTKYKNNKTIDKIINAGDVLYRNARLMNLKKPFLDKEAEQEIYRWTHSALDDDRDIEKAITMLRTNGYLRLMNENNIGVSDFFAPFYRIMNKEKQFTNKK